MRTRFLPQVAQTTLALTLLLIGICYSGVRYSGVRAAETKLKGPEGPGGAGAVAGQYRCGDGLGYNVSLTLVTNGTYAAEWHGCLGKYGDASGTWKLSGKRIVLSATQESGMMKGHLKTLDALKFKGDWILVRRDQWELYGQHGATHFSCFQKVKTTSQ